MRGLVVEFITVIKYSIFAQSPMNKPVLEVFDAQLIPQPPFYPAGFAVEITLGLRMKISARKDLAFFVSVGGIGVGLLAYFISGSASWWILAALLALGTGLIVLGGLIAPPFWWGNRTFTTPMDEPSHEAKQRHET